MWRGKTMTKKEKQIVSKAIEELMDEDGDFAHAIDSLCRLIGWSYPVANVGIKGVSIADLIQQGPGLFSIGDNKKEK